MFVRSSDPFCGPFPSSRRLGPVIFPLLIALVLFAGSPLQAQDCPEPGANQGMILSITSANAETIGDTPQVTVIPLASFVGHEAHQCELLNLGDEIRVSGGVDVQLRCPGGSVITLSQQIRAALVPPDGDQDCKVDLRSGTALSTSEEATGIDAGPVSAGALHTEYQVTLRRNGENAGPSVEVFDGSVEVRARGVAEHLTVRRGHKALLGAMALQSKVLATRDYDQAAVVMARVSAARAAEASKVSASVAYQKLFPAYLSALKQPTSAEHRVTIAAVQLQYNLPRDALYQLSRAEKAHPEQQELKVKIPLAQAVAYKQLKQPSTAATYLDRAKQISPTLFQSLTPSWMQMLHTSQPHVGSGGVVHLVQNLKVAVSTRRIGTGTAFGILVRVTDLAGNPVAGARVEVAAGGGRFSETGGTRVGGMTDVKGAFRTSWKCHPCAHAYVLGVKASKTGYVSASASPRLDVYP